MTTTRDSRTRRLHRNPSLDLLHREESDDRPMIDSEWFPMMDALTHKDDHLDNEIGHCPQAHARETIEELQEFPELLTAERMINHAYLGRVLERASAIGGIDLNSFLAMFTSSDGDDVLVDLLEHRVALEVGPALAVTLADHPRLSCARVPRIPDDAFVDPADRIRWHLTSPLAPLGPATSQGQPQAVTPYRRAGHRMAGNGASVRWRDPARGCPIAEARRTAGGLERVSYVWAGPSVMLAG